MIRALSIFMLALTAAACTVQPMTPAPVQVTAPPVAVVVTVTPAPTAMTPPAETAPVAASAPPESLPGPADSALPALVLVSPTLAPTDVSPVATLPPTAIPLPTETAVLPVAVAPPPSGDVAAAEQYMIDLINAERAAAGVAPLVRDETLMGIARARVADMVARGYTGHTDPATGEHLARAMMRAAGYTSNYLGENWYGSIQPPPGIVDTAMAWFMADPPHAKNILSPNYAWVGVGIAFNGRQWLLVQNFAGPNP
jgi:uncharacterized protein YkwD